MKATGTLRWFPYMATEISFLGHYVNNGRYLYFDDFSSIFKFIILPGRENVLCAFSKYFKA